MKAFTTTHLTDVDLFGEKQGGDASLVFEFDSWVAKEIDAPMMALPCWMPKDSHGRDRLVCKHYLRGLCQLNDGCQFLHSFYPGRTPRCRFFDLGTRLILFHLTRVAPGLITLQASARPTSARLLTLRLNSPLTKSADGMRVGSVSRVRIVQPACLVV